jgi:serine/threonine-protein kinase
MSYESNIWSSAPPPVIGPGTRLNGIYEIDHAIGSGGMGDIYKGHAIQTGDLVAIKIIRADMAENEAALALFRKEASILHNLAHEAIIRYYVFSVDPAIGRPYLAMEFVDGAPLSDVLQRGPLSFDEVRALQRRMAAGLQAAHELGVIHRDISPDNVILPGGDVRRAKIIDFGIARAAKIGGETVIGGGFAGKHNYASPEQLGLFGGEVTAKSDIYSMGLVLAAALLGRPIDMDGTQVEVIDKRRSVPDLGALDTRIRPLIESMLQPRPDDRPESMAAVAEWPKGVGTIMPEARAETRITQIDAKPPPSEERRSLAGVFAAAGLLALLAASGGAIVYALDLWPLGGPVGELSGGPGVPTPPTGAEGRHEEPATVTPADLPPGGEAPVEPPTGPGDAGPVGPAETDVLPPSQDSPPPIEPIPTDAPQSPAGPTEGPDGQPPVTPVVIPQGGAAPPGAPAQEEPVVAPPEPPGGPASPPDVLPPEESPAGEEEPLTRLAQVERYVREYSGGNCFFMTPLSIRDTGEDISARLEVFGSAVEPVAALDEAFKQANGFEAQISFRQVTADQCPAVEFMNRVAGAGAAAQAPALTLSSFELSPGAPLTGSVGDLDGRHVDLLLVSDTGAVTNVSADAAPSGNGLAFTVRPETMRAPAARPNLLIALATREPLGLPSSSLPAGAYFPRVLVAAERSNQEIGVAVKYFNVEG